MNVKQAKMRTALMVAIGGLLSVLQAQTAAQVPTSVTCGSVITEPGEYALVANAFCTDDGITIAASGVRLDLHGFTLTGPGALVFGTVGVQAEGVSDVRITGGAIVSFDNGIAMREVVNLTVHDVQLTGNQRGAALRNVDGSTILGCVVSNNSVVGITFSNDSDDNAVIGNRLTFNDTGVSFNDLGPEIGTSDRNRVIANTVMGNSSVGININVVDTLVVGNFSTGNGTGILLIGDATKTTIRANDASNNLEYGIYFHLDAEGNFVQGNLAIGNPVEDMRDDNLPACLNQWKANRFDTDNEADGPTAGCIR